MEAEYKAELRRLLDEIEDYEETEIKLHTTLLQTTEQLRASRASASALAAENARLSALLAESEAHNAVLTASLHAARVSARAAASLHALHSLDPFLTTPSSPKTTIPQPHPQPQLSAPSSSSSSSTPPPPRPTVIDWSALPTRILTAVAKLGHLGDVGAMSRVCWKWRVALFSSRRMGGVWEAGARGCRFADTSLHYVLPCVVRNARSLRIDPGRTTDRSLRYLGQLCGLVYADQEPELVVSESGLLAPKGSSLSHAWRPSSGPLPWGGRSRVTRLNLSVARAITDRGMQLLLQSGGFLQLVSLNLSACQHLSDKTLGFLVAGCPQLSSVNLTDVSHISDAGLGLFLDGLGATLTELILSGCSKLGPGAAAALGSRAPALTKLDLSRCSGLDDTAIATLLGPQCSPALRSLSISGIAGLTPDALSGFASSPPAIQSSLRELKLSLLPLIPPRSYCTLVGDIPSLSSLTVTRYVSATSASASAMASAGEEGSNDPALDPDDPDDPDDDGVWDALAAQAKAKDPPMRLVIRTR